VLTIRTRGATAKAQRRDLDLFWLKLELTFEGARRHARPFVFTKFCLTQSDLTAPFLAESRERVRVGDAIGAMADAVIIAWDNTDRDHAVKAAARLLRSSGPDCDVHVASVAFPEDGFTVSGLMAALHKAEESVHRPGGPSSRQGGTPQPREGARDRERAC
jgi:hypothetical protein